MHVLIYMIIMIEWRGFFICNKDSQVLDNDKSIFND